MGLGITPRLPLHELDGFTLAIDYKRALVTLDRGDPNLPTVSSSALDYCQGVVQPVTVIRDGVRKEHLVIAASLAEMWLSPDKLVRESGLYTLVNSLAGVAHWTLYGSAEGAGFKPDAMGRKLHPAVAAAPGHYWSARQTAFVAPDQGKIFADLVITSLDFADRKIAEERARIPESGDISNVTMRAFECVSAVLSHTAEWLGHRDGLSEGQAFAGSDLYLRMQPRGLEHWITLFGRDLAACYGPDDALNLDVLGNLSRHVERLFWSFGIYCWTENDAVRCLIGNKFSLQMPR